MVFMREIALPRGGFLNELAIRSDYADVAQGDI
jgi:hypothetical protein